MDYYKKALEQAEKFKGKIKIESKVEVNDREDLSVVYTPGVAGVSLEIAKEKSKAIDLTIKGNAVAVVSDGSSVLGLGNIGPEAALPVMEGKCLLFKKFAGIDAYPIVLNTQKVEEIIATVKNIAPGFAGINLEDISAPRCFEIEERLQNIGIPVFHDDQHGTAIVILAALINAVKIVGKKERPLRIVISGAGAAGQATTKLLLRSKAINIDDVILLDSKGSIYDGREKLDVYKSKIAKITNKNKLSGGLAEVIKGADVFIGVSKPKVIEVKDIKSMNKKPIVFAMANPIPEIMPSEAKKAGAAVVATGRSDFENQVNNALVFPGFFRGLLDGKVKKVTEEMKLASAEALAYMVKNPLAEKILPTPFEKNIALVLSRAVKNS